MNHIYLLGNKYMNIIKLFIILTIINISNNCYSYSFEEIEVAKVIAGEACSEGKVGMQAVANTIYNRSILFNKSPYEVIILKNQYYAYTNPNKEEIFKQCESDALYFSKNINNLKDLTNGSIYFLKIGESKGSWIGQKTVTIGKHIFYRMK